MVMDRDIDASMIIIIIINTNNHYQDHNQLNFARKAIYICEYNHLSRLNGMENLIFNNQQQQKKTKKT